MLSELAETLPGIGGGTELKGSEDVKKGLLQDEDPLLAENATLPTGVFAVHVFGAQNLYLDANFPPEHYGIYVQITAGSTTKCTSVQSPLKKGHVVWDEIRNFPVTISPKVTSAANKVVITVLCFDKLQPIPKHKLLGKMEFHLHKLAKKQWSMETFELQNRKKQYAGDLQLELAFAYGSYGYGLCDQLESHQPPRYYLQQSAFPHLELPTSSAGSSSGIMFAPKRVPHPNIIAFTEKVTNLEPEISPYFSKTNFVPTIDMKSRPLLQQKLTRLDQLHSDYSQLTSRSKRIHFLKRLLQEKDVHRSMAGEQESDSEGSSVENLGDVTQFGLTGALAQMANLTFMAGAPELIQDAEKHMAYGASTSGPSRSVTVLLRRLQAHQVYNNKLSRFQVRQIVEEQPRNLHKAKKRVLRSKLMSWMKRQKKMKQKFLQLLPLVAADLQLLCPVPLRKGSTVCLTDESILSGLSWEERGERNLIHSCALTYQT